MVKYIISTDGLPKGQSLRELQKANGYIWPYIQSAVLIQTLNNFNNIYAKDYLINLIEK